MYGTRPRSGPPAHAFGSIQVQVVRVRAVHVRVQIAHAESITQARHLHSQTLALLRVTLLAVFFILFYLLIIFCLNLSTFYNSNQVVKTRKKKLNYNVTCNRRLHFPLPATSLAFNTNRVRCQWRRDAVLVK